MVKIWGGQSIPQPPRIVDAKFESCIFNDVMAISVNSVWRQPPSWIRKSRFEVTSILPTFPGWHLPNLNHVSWTVLWQFPLYLLFQNGVNRHLGLPKVKIRGNCVFRTFSQLHVLNLNFISSMTLWKFRYFLEFKMAPPPSWILKSPNLRKPMRCILFKAYTYQIWSVYLERFRRDDNF